MATPITPAVLAGAFQNFNLRFQMGFAQAEAWNGAIAMEVPSGTEEEIYAWMQTLPTVRKWVGPRKINRIGANAYRLRNEDWEQTQGVEKNKIEDDKIGVYAPLFQEMGAAKAKWPDQQLAVLLRSGASLLGWDGAAFFSAGHVVDPNGDTSITYDNLYTSKALTADNFEDVYAKMQVIKNGAGEAMGITPDTLFVPPKLRGTALRIIRSRTVAVVVSSGGAAVDNVNEGLVEVRTIPEISSAYSSGSDSTWYLGRCKGAVKPLIFQKRSDSGFIARTRPDSDNVFMLKEYQYGFDMRAAFGYALPFLLARCEQ